MKQKYKPSRRVNLRRVIDLLSQAQFAELGEIAAVVRDPKDDIIVATAVAGGADYGVSEDNDLLDLKQVSGIPIINTQAFLVRLEGSDEP